MLVKELDAGLEEIRWWAQLQVEAEISSRTSLPWFWDTLRVAGVVAYRPLLKDDGRGGGQVRG